MLSGLRLLIVEDEFLIALGMQSMMEGMAAESCVLARDFSEAAALADSFSRFDVAIINQPRPGPDMETVERLVAAGVAIVICSADPVTVEGTPIAGTEVITKPFLDDDLAAACLRAIGRRGSS